MIINSTQSLFDAIEFIANSNYPIVSKSFKEMVQKINLGYPPEKLLLNYMNSIENQTFKERILNLLGYNLIYNKKENKNADISLELMSKYQEYTKQLDTRTTILICVNIFLPIFTTILFSFYITISNFLILILIPFHLFILLILKKILFKKEFFILGSEEHFSNEFNELLIFFTNFANKLCLNNSPEIAFLESVKIHNGKLKDKLLSIINKIINRNYHLENIWKLLSDAMESSQSKLLINLTYKMLKKDFSESGNRLKNIIENININKKMIEKRHILLRSQQFKVLILLFILSALLGLMTNIIPIISQFFLIINTNNNININLIHYNYIEIVPMIITYSVILFMTSIIILKSVKFKNHLFISILVLILYYLIFYSISLFF